MTEQQQIAQEWFESLEDQTIKAMIQSLLEAQKAKHIEMINSLKQKIKDDDDALTRGTSNCINYVLEAVEQKITNL